MDSVSLGRKSRRTVACDECKRRKVRCSAEAVCKNCSRDHKPCVYSSLEHRVTALQRTVDHYETLIDSIRNVWALHVPGITLEHALATTEQSPINLENVPSPQNDVRSWQRTSSQSVPAAQLPDEVSALGLDTPEETPEDTNAEDFEFDESQHSEAFIDGPSFLAVGAGKSGYTGPLPRRIALEVMRTLPSRDAVEDAPRGSIPHHLMPTSSRGFDYTMVESLINAYFSHYHPSYPLLHEGLFRARLSGAVAKPRDGSWPLLFNIVAAVGAFAGDSGSNDIHENYYQAARDSISLAVIEKGSLCYVQGLMLMADYLQKRNKPNAGFALIGVAWSMAMAIGLHREFGTFCTTPYTMELCRRTWWTLFVSVSGAQLTMGRPPASLVGVNLHLPVNLNDSSLTVDMTELPDPQEGPTVATCLIAEIKLTQIANVIQAEIQSSQLPALQRIDVLRQQLIVWRASLPSYFEEHTPTAKWFEMPKRLVLWRALHLRIILNRPFFFRAMEEKRDLADCEGPARECINAANECIASICQTLDESPDCKPGFTWYATYWVVSAGFVLATCYAYTPARTVKKHFETRMEQIIKALQFLGVAHSVAGRARRVFERLLQARKDGNITPLTVESGHTAWDTFIGAESGLASMPANYFGLDGPESVDFHSPQPNSVVAHSGGDLLWMYAELANAGLSVPVGDVSFQ